MNLVSRIAGAARLLATGKLAQSTGFDGAQMEWRLIAWRAGGDTINRLILQGSELQRARGAAGPDQSLCLERGGELHRPCRGLRHQAVKPGR